MIKMWMARNKSSRRKQTGRGETNKIINEIEGDESKQGGRQEEIKDGRNTETRRT